MVAAGFSFISITESTQPGALLNLHLSIPLGMSPFAKSDV